MVNFIVSPKTLVIGEILSYEINQMDSSKGSYTIAIKDYNSSMDEFTLHQQQNVLNKTYNDSGLTGVGSGNFVRSYFTTLTVFYFDSYNSTDFSSVEEFEQSVTLGEYTAKSETFNISVYDGKRKNGIVTWLRQWLPTKEEVDTLFLTDSGWQSCTISSGYSIYTSGMIVRVRKVGKVVEFSGVVKPTAEKSTTGEFQIATIPSGYRPSNDQHKICQGSNMDRWLLQVKSTGAVTASRYGTTSPIKQPKNAWLNFVITYMID